MATRFIICFLFLIIQAFGVAQVTYKAEHLKFSNGLPSDIVLYSTKKQGKLYIATQRGLCLYDGYRFIKSAQISSVTNALCVRKNTLYFYAAGKGLCSINTIFDKPQILSKVNYNDATPNNDHYDNIYVDHKNRVWCSDYSTIKYFTDFESHSYPIRNEDKDITLNVTFLESATGDLIIATEKGVFIWDEKQKKMEPHPNVLLAEASVSSATAIGDALYFTTFERELMVYDSKTNRLSVKRIDQAEISPLKFVSNTTDAVLYDKNTLYLYDIKKQKTKIIFTGSDKINHVYYDEALGLFWISTSHGLVKLSKIGNEIVSLKIPDSKTVVSIVQDAQRSIWCVTKTNTLYCLSKEKKISAWLSPRPGTSFEQVFLKNGQVFATANDGLYRLEAGGLKLKISAEIPFKKAMIDNHNLLWVIPLKGAIKVYDAVSFKEKSNHIANTASFWSDNTFNDIATAPDGRVWLASWMPKDYGISYFDEQTHLFVQINGLTQFKNNPKFVTDYYNRIAFISRNNIAFSGYGGWNIVSPAGRIIKSLNTDLYKVANDHIEGITEDSRGNIWFACAEGLNQYNFKTNKVVRVSAIDGLESNDLTYGFFATENNKLLLGNNGGLQVLDLNQITKTQLINQLELTAILKDGVNINAKKNEAELDYDFTELDILFSSLSFSEKEKIIYRYQFKGDGKWNYLGSNPKLSLIKPSPGSYDIVIQAGDNLGNWQPKLLEVHLKINPPFYYTPWFIALVFLLLLSLVLLVNRYLIRQEKIKGFLKRKIKDVEMQTLRSQMNPHFLFNSLNSINSFIIQQRSIEASGYLTTFSKLMRNILENSRQEAISLEKELETLKMYLELESVRLEHQFDYEIICDKSLDAENVRIPPLIIQPFAENAIWHGLHNKKDKGHLKIILSEKDDGILSIRIIDDGIGRKASSMLKKEQVSHKSYGIGITVDRLVLLNPKNSLTIIDLTDGHSNATGTEVELQIYYHD
ncbi:MAG: hypothetical protein CFE23_01080 [Flavobacterium sp. BFFFF1]|uniref:sensor histidine kinase n=1 Tax=Flavobacterium sp. BFFFF1 TaxID=2015557 RepID=UPI000BDADF75|nr:sensor histidine kinase [Flavobacterium sp. BFFFF1]OYU82341.1 MAG: hypothetical protein CFE23_01080 [Flavobacterium sp. BFFFF1]